MAGLRKSTRISSLHSSIPIIPETREQDAINNENTDLENSVSSIIENAIKPGGLLYELQEPNEHIVESLNGIANLSIAEIQHTFKRYFHITEMVNQKYVIKLKDEAEIKDGLIVFSLFELQLRRSKKERYIILLFKLMCF